MCDVAGAIEHYTGDRIRRRARGRHLGGQSLDLRLASAGGRVLALASF